MVEDLLYELQKIKNPDADSEHDDSDKRFEED
jgi:hypothetical protein